MVVAGQQQHAAVFRRAGEIAVAQHVAAAVDPRALGVPEGEDAVVVGIPEEVELLGAPDGGRRQILVHPGLEMDVVLLEELLRLPHGLVDAAQRRAAIARDIAGGVLAGGEVAMALHHGQAHQGLGPGDEDASALQRVFVVERDGGQRHGSSQILQLLQGR